MTFAIQCPGCGRTGAADEASVGQAIRCVRCSRTFTVGTMVDGTVAPSVCPKWHRKSAWLTALAVAALGRRVLAVVAYVYHVARNRGPVKIEQGKIAKPGDTPSMPSNNGAVASRDRTPAAEMMAEKEYDRAIADFNKALQHDPRDLHAYVGRGSAYLRKQQYDLAIADYSKAVAIDPKVRTGLWCTRRRLLRERGL